MGKNTYIVLGRVAYSPGAVVLSFNGFHQNFIKKRFNPRLGDAFGHDDYLAGHGKGR
jgi:hypothetical protein